MYGNSGSLFSLCGPLSLSVPPPHLSLSLYFSCCLSPPLIAPLEFVLSTICLWDYHPGFASHPSAVSHQPSAVNHQPSSIICDSTGPPHHLSLVARYGGSILSHTPGPHLGDTLINRSKSITGNGGETRSAIALAVIYRIRIPDRLARGSPRIQHSTALDSTSTSTSTVPLLNFRASRASLVSPANETEEAENYLD